MTKAKILVVDDNAGIRSALGILLPMHFSQVEMIPSPNELISKAGTFRPDVILLDMNFHRDINTGNEGLYWLSEIKSRFPGMQVVLFTAYADIALAVEGMKRGAADFIVKPWDNGKLINILENACRKAGKHGAAASRPQERPAKITGENGTGKDVLAKEIHRLSGRSAMPMISVDLGAVPETLFESELFGHAKGAFTDAKTDFAGKFEQAQGGTLFLDEIGNIPLHLQSKLLRALQNRTVTRVGDTRSIPVNIRLVCATNMDLPQMVRDGKFREDLFYRINTVRIHLPPLRERKDEIPRLAEMFLEKFSGQYNRRVSSISDDALHALASIPWKGKNSRTALRKRSSCLKGKRLRQAT